MYLFSPVFSVNINKNYKWFMKKLLFYCKQKSKKDFLFLKHNKTQIDIHWQLNIYMWILNIFDCFVDNYSGKSIFFLSVYISMYICFVYAYVYVRMIVGVYFVLLWCLIALKMIQRSFHAQNIHFFPNLHSMPNHFQAEIS